MENTSRPDGARRDELAVIRTRLANERTLLAYLRTAILLVSSGGAVLQLFAGTTPWAITGWLLVVGGVALALLGLRRFAVMQKALR